MFIDVVWMFCFILVTLTDCLGFVVLLVWNLIVLLVFCVLILFMLGLGVVALSCLFCVCGCVVLVVVLVCLIVVCLRGFFDWVDVLVLICLWV